MAFDTATISKILKEVYEGPVREQLNNKTYFLTKVRKNKKNFPGGKYAKMPLHTNRNVGVGSRQEDVGADGAWNQIPTAGNQGYEEAIYKPKLHYGQIRLTGFGMASAERDIASFIRGLKSEMDGLEIDCSVDQNRQFWHDGSSILTRCRNLGAGTTVGVESTKFLQVGMAVSLRNGADGQNVEGANKPDVTVSSITDAQNFVASASVNVDADDVVIRTGTRNDTSSTTWKTAIEMWGLEALLSNANPGNGLDGATDVDSWIGRINRTGNLFWQTPVLTNPAGAGTNRPLALDDMQQAFDTCDIEMDVVPGLILTNHALKRRYAALLQSDKRYIGETTLDGGYKALEYNGVPLMADKDASLTLTPQQLNRMYFLAMSAFEFHVLKDWQWNQRGGDILHQTAMNKDSFQGFFYSYSQLGIDNSRKCAVLTDLLETA